MKLKKLEVIGFKSFYEKATIAFPPGISAVVGPNGCGKSNVIDAIRWVMGEQSVRQLRGKSMEDVIFSGTNGKPPLNMAEVSLTLSNDNGDAPEELKDFTEINLTRRLYRSGESGYFLNKQPCRLKDIHNVFLGSGLGSKSYAVIQQGNIGAITDAGPEERRYFIEEAAGTTRYKSRKTEALRKVELTKRNLLRVADITSEIKRQMASLKRQARKAELYNNYQRRIRELDIHLGVRYYDDFTEKIEQTEALLSELKDADIGHSSELKKLDAAVEEIKLKRWQKNQEISQQKSRKFEIQRNIDRRENDLEHLRSEIERLSRETDELVAARRQLEEKNQDMISEVAQVEKNTQDLKNEIGVARDDLSRERQAAQQINQKLETLNRELEKHKSHLMELISQETQYKNIYQNAANNKESLNRRLKRADEEEALAQKQINTAREKESQTQTTLASIRQEIEDLAQEIEQVRNRLDEKAKALAAQVKLAQTLELERNTTRSKYATLKKMEDNYEWYRDGVKAIMRAQSSSHKSQPAPDEAQDDDLPATNPDLAANVLALMADIIEADPVYETAIEAVLGESLQYIIVKDQQTGLDAIDYLQTHGAGRSGFIPVSSVKPIPMDAHHIPDSSRLLLNHISVKPGFEKAAEVLLGDVVITDTVQEAIQLFNQNGVLQRIVTKNGDVISRQGILVGGSKDKLSGILAKKNEIKELESQEVQLTRDLEKARDDQHDLESEVKTLESDMQKLIEKKNLSTQDEIEAEKALYKATEGLKNAQRHLEIVNLEQEQLLVEASDIDAEMTKYNQALADVTAKIEAAQDNIARRSGEIKTVSTEMDEFNKKIVDLQLNLTALNTKLENSAGSLRRLKEFHEDGLRRLEQLTVEIKQKRQKAEGSKFKIEDFEQSLSEMYAEIEKLEKVLDLNETDYQAIDERLKDSDNQISEIKSKRDETNEKFRLLELEQSERKIKRDNITSRLEERYQNSFGVLREDLNAPEPDSEDFSQMTVERLEEELTLCKTKIAKIVDVNLGAIKEYEQLKDRYDFLEEQRTDLEKAIEDLQKVIKKINKITQERFMETFHLINQKLAEVFPRLFNGGTAKLVLTQPENPLETGVEFMIHPPGKKLTRLSLLSGGEKALSAIAFIFSIFLIKPASFCLLDEIDAPLDDANVFRFNDLLQIIGEKSQIIMITHNKRSMEFADMLFGITMEQKGISKVVTVNLRKTQEAA